MPSPKSATRSSTTKPATARSGATKSGPTESAKRAGAEKAQNKPAPRPASGQVGMTRRQARAWLRASERRRRTITNWTIFGVLVAIIGGFALVQTHPWTNLGGTSRTSTTASACPAPTATAVGPLPSIAPDATPPPVQGTTVNGDQGLQYIDVKVGCGDAVKSGDALTVIYTGWLQADGKEFDSSLSHGGTFQVTVGQGSVIKGWDLGLVGMKKYGTRRLIIPAALGYGAQGSPPTIPPNANLVFDITVVGINE
ncbi:MAG TPA: FKBP-type peptidyl-prolyl cis-trans isomerase [Ktedonobacterales bacterium]|nr:FKBP-type peptidyl-prolyl cis-trans isomerase [Ktedonobacterales bacterium]